MIEGTKRPKVNNSDRVIEAIRRGSTGMDLDEYAKATGLEKEFIFRILKGDIENVDEETYKKLLLLH